MEKTNLRRCCSALMYIASCALSGTPPKEAECLNPEGLCAMAAEHTLGALICHGLELAGAASMKAVSDKNLAIRKIMLFDVARAEILSALDKAGINYMVLKGVILKELYPSIGLRQMSDNDILISPRHRKDVRNIMSRLGYTVNSYGKGHHDVYIKEPVYNFEIHVNLFSISKKRFYPYFKDALEKAMPLGDGSLGRKMTDEDFYIYLKAHEYKHYVNSGIGLRTLIDTYIFLKAKSDTLNFDYVTAECEKIGMVEYELQTRALALKLFAPENAEELRKFALTGEGVVFTEEEWEMLEFYATSGTYGRFSMTVEREMQEYEAQHKGGTAKLRYLLRRIFPDMDYYKESAPFVYKYKILIPFYCIGRLIRALLRQPRMIFSQLKSVLKYKKK